MIKEIVIASACRTPIGNFEGSLKETSAVRLGATTIKEAIKRAGISPEAVDQAILGCVLQAGLGQNMARQAAIFAGIPETASAMTINKVCASGLQAVILAAQAILSGDSDIVVAGGVESMSRAPYLLQELRAGHKMGDIKARDSIISDALTDAFGQYHMGITAENIARKYSITREEQDEYAILSQNRAEKAQLKKQFTDEIAPIEIKHGKNETKLFDTDEYPRHGTTIDKLAKLKPAFIADGTVTAGNSSGINDGAAALIIMSAEKAKELGIKPIASILSYASKGLSPEYMGLGPIAATKEALSKSGLSINDIDLIEANEAFAAQTIAVLRESKMDIEKTNVNGGAIALGHPVGASGARILVTLLYEMIKRNSTHGLATLCVGGGMGTALVIKRTEI